MFSFSKRVGKIYENANIQMSLAKRFNRKCQFPSNFHDVFANPRKELQNERFRIFGN